MNTAAHDRKATHLTRGIEPSPIEVKCPHDPADTIVAMRNIRDDLLARKHARRQIDDAQFAAGRRYQALFEIVENPARAFNYANPKVDGGGAAPDIMTDARNKATKELARIDAVLGARDTKVVRLALCEGCTMARVAMVMGSTVTEFSQKYYGRILNDALEIIAELVGFVSKRA